MSRAEFTKDTRRKVDEVRRLQRDARNAINCAKEHFDEAVRQIVAADAELKRAIRLAVAAQFPVDAGAVNPAQSAGGKARARSLSAERRSQIARAAATARWERAR